MNTSLTLTQGNSDSVSQAGIAQYASVSKLSTNLTILKSIATPNNDDEDASSIDLDFAELYKGLSVTSQQIVDKINELLKEKLPEGLQSLSPQDATPEATAERIVQSTTAFFDIYAQQNKNLQGEELLNSFLETIKGGIKTGYDEAFAILEGLGAFNVEGVKTGVESTRKLIDEKLAAYEVEKRKELGLDPIDVSQKASSTTRDAVLAVAGGSLSLVA